MQGTSAQASGKHGVLVGIIKGDVVVTPLAEIAGKMRPADASLLERIRMKPVRTLSGGTRQKLSAALASVTAKTGVLERLFGEA